MTSNIGAHIIQEGLASLLPEGSEQERGQSPSFGGIREAVFDLLKKTLRPEFLNRIDEVIMFNPLTRDEIQEIVRIQFNSVVKMLEKNEIKLSITDKAIEWLAQLGYDPQFGARPLHRALQKYIEDPMAEEIIKGELSEGDIIELIKDPEQDVLKINVSKPPKAKKKKEES